MISQLPPLGWNSWNTFGEKINEKLIFDMADCMVEKGFLKAGYEYLVIDDCWSLRERDDQGHLVPDPEKFPHGMKAVSDYVHAKGLKFGMYSCAGVRTCAGYPASYDHEFQDARDFASWGVDFLKYDFCNFPVSGDCKNRYQTMSMALKASGREILFSACNWGQQEPWQWMDSVGAHMYRSTGDIMGNYTSFSDIFKSQLANMSMSKSGCFNDMDMLAVGMCGNGNVGVGRTCTYEEYRLQFALWCLCGVPLMMGADLRNVAPEYLQLMQHPDLLRIDQDEECRAPYIVNLGRIVGPNPDPKEGEPTWLDYPDSSYVLLRHLSGNEFALAMINFAPKTGFVNCEFADMGLPFNSGMALEMRDVFTGETIHARRDFYTAAVPSHDMKLFVCRMVPVHA